MGTFISLSGIIGKSQIEVVDSLKRYTNSVDGNLIKEDLDGEHNNCCIIEEGKGNTTIYYPNHFLEWKNASEYISKDLNTPVFSFHIHDGDLWMYVLYVDGAIVDQFNPIPDYWNNNISEKERLEWKGNASLIVEHVGLVERSKIEKYLIQWDLENEENTKSYPDDEYGQEDWQLLDFLRKIGFSYPIDDEGNPTGQTVKIWTKQLPFEISNAKPSNNLGQITSKKSWWKFW